MCLAVAALATGAVHRGASASPDLPGQQHLLTHRHLLAYGEGSHRGGRVYVHLALDEDRGHIAVSWWEGPQAAWLASERSGEMTFAGSSCYRMEARSAADAGHPRRVTGTLQAGIGFFHGGERDRRCELEISDRQWSRHQRRLQLSVGGTLFFLKGLEVADSEGIDPEDFLQDPGCSLERLLSRHGPAAPAPPPEAPEARLRPTEGINPYGRLLLAVAPDIMG